MLSYNTDRNSRMQQNALIPTNGQKDIVDESKSWEYARIGGHEDLWTLFDKANEQVEEITKLSIAQESQRLLQEHLYSTLAEEETNRQVKLADMLLSLTLRDSGLPVIMKDDKLVLDDSLSPQAMELTQKFSFDEISSLLEEKLDAMLVDHAHE